MGVSRTVAVALVCALALAAGARAATLDDVRQRGSLNCGVNPSRAGFAVEGENGAWSGFDVDYCRAIAAAVLGDADAVTFVPLAARARFDELRDRKVDVLVRDTAWTMARDTVFGLTFAAVNYYNGIGFMVPVSLGVNSALQLNGVKVCVETGSLAEVVLADYFAARGMEFAPFAMDDDEARRAAYESHECSVLAGDRIELYAARLRLARPDDSAVLPESLSKDPYGLVVRRGDEAWLAIVRWVHFALLSAEELGVTSANVGEMLGSSNEEIRNLLGAGGAFGEGLGLSNRWAADALMSVGNYGEIFERNLGSGSPLRVERGLNRLWTDGGLQFAPPIR
jgi:general L-amino acid transport system substrate-binding protein